jgi:hypothetical protein
MKHILSLFAAFLLAFSSVHANHLSSQLVALTGFNETSKKIEASVSATVMEQYFGTIVGDVFHPGSMSFTTLSLSREDVFGSNTLNLCAGTNVDKFKHDPTDSGDEFGLNYNRRFGKEEYESVVYVDVGLFYQAIGHLTKFHEDVLQSYVKVTLPRVPYIEPYAQFFHFAKTGESSLDVGSFAYAGITRTWNIGIKYGNHEVKVITDAKSGWSGGVFGVGRGWAYHRATLSSQFGFDGGWTFVPSLIWQTPANSSHSRLVRGTRTWWMFTVSKKLG